MISPQAIIFDMDGLLVDSETVWLIAETEMVESRGHQYGHDVREQLIGMRMDEFVAILRDHFGFEESVGQLVDELNARMLELIPTHVKPQPGATELIDYIAGQDWPVAIASSSPMVAIDAIVKAQGWGDFFTVRCSADDVPRGKPAPDVYLAAARALHVDPARCLALEDSPNGSRAAVAAGMTCYAVPDKSHSPKPAFRGITDHVFDSLYDVLNILQTG